jgi:ubiquinone/menaquinone biosynthesis C-methylase UbiE
MTTELLASLSRLSTASNEEWLHTLTPENWLKLEFHDRHRDNHAGEVDSNKMFYGITEASGTYLRAWTARNAKNRVFLDYACGKGDCVMLAAQCGAELAVGIDISRISIENARRTTSERGLENTRFVQADCENTTFPSNSFDAVLCSGMLHHLALSYAVPEIRRILERAVDVSRWKLSRLQSRL